MADDNGLPHDYQTEIEQLRARLEEAEDTLRAIQSGEVDALVVAGPDEEVQVYTLKGEERVYRVLVESINEGAVILTGDGSVMYANQAFARMSGVPLERVIGSHVGSLVIENDEQVLERLLAQDGGVTRGAEVTLAHPAIRSGVPVYLSFGPLVVDEVQAIAAVVTDLTARKQAEAEIRLHQEHLEELVELRTSELSGANEALSIANEELRTVNEELFRAKDKLETVNNDLSGEVAERTRAEEALRASEERFRAVFDATADAIVIANDEGYYLQVNPAAASLFGLPQSELIGRHMSEFVGSDLDFDDLWSRFLREGHFAGEHQLRRADNRVVDADYHVSANIQPGRHLAIIRDITERKRQIDRERHIAETLQNALVPPAPYAMPCCHIAIKYEAALQEAEVGGDFYDIFEISDNKIGIVVGDVAGKGLPAAIRVAAARHSMRSYAYLDPRPSKVMTLANEALCRDDPSSGMLTAFFATVDTRVGIMTWANGGHEPPLLRKATGQVLELSVHGRALGVECGYDYPESTRILSPGDILLVVTDGITEARPNNFELFGIEGVHDYLSSDKWSTLDELVNGLLETARTYGKGRLRDDAVILAFCLTGE